MTISTRYANAFTEVYEILQHLEKSSYSKISSHLLDTIKNNRNKNYIYIIDPKKELKEQEMLPETKAILFNIFRDYLANEKQKQTIKKWQLKEFNRLEKEKKKYYDINILNKKPITNTQKSQSNFSNQNNGNTNLVKISRPSILQKIIVYLKEIIFK